MRNDQKTPFPTDALLLVNPVTKEVKDYQPIEEHLHEYYRGDKSHLVESLHQVASYLMRRDRSEESAETLREMFGVVTDLAVAFDSCTVRKMR